MKSLLMAGMLCVSNLTMAQTNVIQNPDFDRSFAPTGIASNWENNSYGHNTVAWSADTVTPHSGEFSQKITCTAFSNGAVQFLSSTDISLLKNRAYQVKAWLKGNNIGRVTLQLRKMQANYTDYCSQSFAITPEWAEYSFTSYASGTDNAARLFMYFKSTGTVYIDDVSCQMLETSFTSPTPPATPIPESLFGMHMHRAWYKTQWPAVSFKVWRLWDAEGSCWDNLEPTKGNWNFSRLDKYFELAATHEVDLIVPLAYSPVWASARPTEMGASGQRGSSAEPADINDWCNYVKTVGEYCKDHSRGRAKHFEIWNEPAFHPGSFFSGTPEMLVELSRQAYLILKKIDPSYQVISSSVVGDTGIFDTFMSKGAKHWCDIIGYHFYNTIPEDSLGEMERVRQAMARNGVADKPLWNTEAGWYVQDARKPKGLALKDAGDYILRSYILNWANGIPVYCFYSWDSGTMGPIEEVWDGVSWAPVKEKSYMAQGYRTANDWLIGAVMTSCWQDATNATWTAELTRDGQNQMIVWNPETNAVFTLRPEWGFITLQTIAGTNVSINGRPNISVDGSPVLLKGPPSTPPTAPRGATLRAPALLPAVRIPAYQKKESQPVSTSFSGVWYISTPMKKRVAALLRVGVCGVR